MRIHTIILLVTFVLCGLALILMPSWTVDDAYIAYRYGKNLLVNGELNWNPGEPPVEGYTGVLLPLISAGLHSFTDNIVPFIRLISLYCLLGSAIFLYILARRFNVSRIISSITVLLFCLAPMLYVHVFSGLETLLFTYLFISSIYQIIRLMDKGWPWIGSMLLVPSLILLSLCRPEGMLFSGIALGILVFGPKIGAWKVAKLKLLVIIGSIIIINGLYLLWKWNYYGSLLPNTYYAKAYPGFMNPESIKDFLRFTGYYLAIPLLASLVAYIAGTKQEHRIDQKRAFLFGSIFIFLGLILISYSRSQLFMNYASRFFFPYYGPLLLILAILGNEGWRIIQENRQENPLLFNRVLKMAAVLAVFQLGILVTKFKSERQFVLNMSSIMEEEYRPAAEILKSGLLPGSTIISYMDAGAISYLTDMRVVDFGRLNDTYLARQRPDSINTINYFFQQDAEAVVFTNLSPDRFDYLDEAFAIQRDPRFRNYQLVGSYGNSRGFPYYQFLYFRSDLLDSFY